jgi:hypothetical protein
MSWKVGLSSLSEGEQDTLTPQHGLGHEVDTRTNVTKSIHDLLLVDHACDSRISIVFPVQDY